MEPDNTETYPVTKNIVEVETIELKPQVGMIVGYVLGYVLPDCRHLGEVRPAIIVKVWSDTCVQLQVFIDGTNDYPNATAPMWATSVVYDSEKKFGTWHYLFGVVEAELPTTSEVA